MIGFDTIENGPSKGSTRKNKSFTVYGQYGHGLFLPSKGKQTYGYGGPRCVDHQTRNVRPFEPDSDSDDDEPAPSEKGPKALFVTITQN